MAQNTDLRPALNALGSISPKIRRNGAKIVKQLIEGSPPSVASNKDFLDLVAALSLSPDPGKQQIAKELAEVLVRTFQHGALKAIRERS
ncbi:MAG TPA: hypothetical protein VMV79_07960, partial [Alphaproteobacteria bacterium]|nr:hypothetical protein [Alphaproteobacteria bacterium]